MAIRPVPRVYYTFCALGACAARRSLSLRKERGKEPPRERDFDFPRHRAPARGCLIKRACAHGKRAFARRAARPPFGFPPGRWTRDEGTTPGAVRRPLLCRASIGKAGRYSNHAARSAAGAARILSVNSAELSSTKRAWDASKKCPLLRRGRPAGAGVVTLAQQGGSETRRFACGHRALAPPADAGGRLIKWAGAQGERAAGATPRPTTLPANDSGAPAGRKQPP
jgi:hypothetical protein